MLSPLITEAISRGWSVTFHPPYAATSPPINVTVTRYVYAGRSLGYVAAVGRAQGTDPISALTLALSRATSAADLLEISLDTPSTLDIPHLLGLTKPAAIGIARRI